MDALELLGQLGRVEPADQKVIDVALDRLGEAISLDAGQARTSTAQGRRHPRLVIAASTTALVAAAAIGLIAVLGHSEPGGLRPSGQHQPGAAAAASAPQPASVTHGSPTVAAILTAFSARADDILMVTKVVRGEGTCCKTIMWISPVGPAQGATVRSRILTFSLGGSRLSDTALSYPAPRTAPATAGLGCAQVFGRPKVELPPAAGLPGTMTQVSYPDRIWIQGDVRIQPATVPTATMLSACLRAGQWREVGRSMLAGSRVIELASADGSQRLWVNAASFLPARLVATTPTPYGSITISFEFSFVPPTAANQAMLAAPVIPAGFSRQHV